MLSVVIPVKNGGTDLERCLRAISSQVVSEEVEIVIVDSGSTDGSIAVAQAHGAVVIEIPPTAFTHGGSRNLGAARARGDILVFISQDAVPVGEAWLARLTAPLRADPALAGVYGRQIPHEDARPPEVYFLDFLYGPTPRRQHVDGIDDISMDTTLFSNVNSAIRRSMWEAFPFPTDVVMSEDQIWSRQALLAGHDIVYEPQAAVRHSHNYTIVDAFRRFFDSGVSSEHAYLADNAESGSALRRRALNYALGEARWLWRTGQRRWMPYAAVYEAAKMAGLVCGINHRLFPVSIQRRFSHLPAAFGDRSVN